MVAYLQRRHYGPPGRPLRACHPRDLLDQVTALCRYRGVEPSITRELLDAACASYFVDGLSDAPRSAPRAAPPAHGGALMTPALEVSLMDRPISAAMSDLVARATIGALFTLLSINLFADFMRTGHVTGLLLLVSESLVVVLTIVRRRAIIVDRSAAAAMMTTVSLVGPVLLRADRRTAVAGRAIR